jgi:pimeloyl-ACP methyl ester carboxylesterase
MTHVKSSDGTRIEYETDGDGPGLVVVPGALLAAKDYRALTLRLCTTFTVHAMDRRGRGGSGAQGSRYSIERECEDLDAVLRKTGARYLFGHSYGGLVVLQCALRLTSRIDRIAVFEPAVSVDGSLPSAFVPAVTEAIARRRYGRAMALVLTGLELAGPLGRLPMPLLAVVTSVILHTVARDLLATLPAVPGEAAVGHALDGPASAYAGISAPTLLMVGETGPTYLHSAAAALAAAMPAARLAELLGVGHEAPQRAPDLVAARLRAFLT